MKDQPNNSVEFGWGAPPIGEQFPIIPADIAEHFDKDSKAIIRLSIRGIIPDSQKNAAFKRLTKSIEMAISRAMKRQAA